MKVKNIMLLGLIGISLSGCVSASDYYYEYGKKVNVTTSYEQRAVNSNNVDYYITDSGNKVGVTDKIIIECKSGIECTAILNTHGYMNVSKLSDKLFIITINEGENIFEVSRKLYNDKDIKLAHPNFIKTKKRR